MVYLIYCIYRKLNDYIKCMLNGYINIGYYMFWYINICISIIFKFFKIEFNSFSILSEKIWKKFIKR